MAQRRSVGKSALGGLGSGLSGLGDAIEQLAIKRQEMAEQQKFALERQDEAAAARAEENRQKHLESIQADLLKNPQNASRFPEGLRKQIGLEGFGPSEQDLTGPIAAQTSAADNPNKVDTPESMIAQLRAKGGIISSTPVKGQTSVMPSSLASLLAGRASKMGGLQANAVQEGQNTAVTEGAKTAAVQKSLTSPEAISGQAKLAGATEGARQAQQYEYGKKKFDYEHSIANDKARQAAISAALPVKQTLNKIIVGVKPDGDLQLQEGVEAMLGQNVLGRAGAFGTSFMSPGGPTADARILLNRLSAQNVVKLVGEMKSQSATGAAGFGNLSDADREVLGAAATQLSTAQSRGQFVQYLKELNAVIDKVLAPPTENQTPGLGGPARPPVYITGQPVSVVPGNK